MNYLNQEINTKNLLINYISSGFKPKKDFKVGLEFESFLYNKYDFSFLPYYHGYGLYTPSIKSVLRGFNHKKWADVNEHSEFNTIGLKSNIGSVSLEPGGQIEFSSIPTSNLHTLKKYSDEYFNDLIEVLNKENIGIYNLGFNPKFSNEELPLIPKQRYEFMYSYMPKVGSMGRNMMKQSCTLQTNLDYSSEEDLKKKFRVSMALQPLIGALFANSPIVEKKLTGDLSHRIKIWHNTDNDRSGILKCAFDDNFTIEKYVDYLIMIPMYFLYRDSKYISIPNITFQEYMIGKYKFKDFKPTVGDFETHLSTAFPDVRIKTYIETRLADCPDMDLLICLSALMVGLLYDDTALDNIYNLIKTWKYEEVCQLRLEIIKDGLNAKIHDKKLYEIALDVINISKFGLKQRNLGEEIYLDPIEKIAVNKKTLAESKIELFKYLDENVDEFIKSITINS